MWLQTKLQLPGSTLKPWWPLGLSTFKAVHSQRDTWLPGKGCDLGPIDSLVEICIESCNLAATEPPSPGR